MKRLFLGVSAASIAAVASLAADTSWTQWGGGGRNFVVQQSPALAVQWPATGPRRIWERALGEGHSSILVDGNRLYTMYRAPRSQSETVAAFDEATGKTMWEHSHASPTAGLALENGVGPHSTPLLVGNTLIAAGSRMELFALDKTSGKVLWQHNLGKEFGAPQDDRGYSPSPIAFRDTVIVPAGGKGSSIVAFKVADGSVAWRAGDYPVAAASPILIEVGGQQQLVITGDNEMLGVDPSNGAVLWRHPHSTQWGLNISTPVWGPDNKLFVSAAYNNGARMLQLAQGSGATQVKELWFQNRMRVHIGNAIRIGDFIVGSSGDFGPCPTVAVDVNTGEVLWQSRDFARATFLYADGKLVILDEDGNVGLATATRKGLTVHAKASVLANKAWTVPTLVGSKLYVRDRARMMALELGR